MAAPSGVAHDDGQRWRLGVPEPAEWDRRREQAQGEGAPQAAGQRQRLLGGRVQGLRGNSEEVGPRSRDRGGNMKFRFIAAVIAGTILLLGMTSATPAAALRAKSKI